MTPSVASARHKAARHAVVEINSVAQQNNILPVRNWWNSVAKQ